MPPNNLFLDGVPVLFGHRGSFAAVQALEYFSVTLLHCSEHLASIPDKPIVRCRQPVLVGGRTQWVDVESLDPNKPMGCWKQDRDVFEVVISD